MVHEAKDSVDVRLREAMEGGVQPPTNAGKGKGRTVEPPTPDLDHDGNSAAGGIIEIGKEDADEGGEIVEVDLS